MKLILQTIICLFAFWGCTQNYLAKRIYPLERQAVVCESLVLNTNTYIAPFEIMDAFGWEDGGSIGLILKDSNGNQLEIVEYNGFYENRDFVKGRVYFGTANPSGLKKEFIVKDLKLLTCLLQNIEKSIQTYEQHNASLEIEDLDIVTGKYLIAGKLR